MHGPIRWKGAEATEQIAADEEEGVSGLALLDQIRTVDKPRLVKRLGAIDDAVLTVILETLQELFAI